MYDNFKAKFSGIGGFFAIRDGISSLPEQDGFRQWASHLTVRGLQAVAVVLLIQDVLLWPTDSLVLPPASKAFYSVRLLRWVVAGFCIATLIALEFVRFLRARPVTFGMLMLTLSMACVGWVFGRNVGLGSSLSYQIFSMPMAVILLIMPLGQRILWTMGLVVAYLSAFFIAAPGLFTPYQAGPMVIWLLAAVSGAIVVGHVFYLLLWSNFYKQYMLDRSADELNSEIQQQKTDIKKLVLRLEKIEERERINFAQEIHDELGQVLAGIRMEIDHLHMLLDTNEPQRVNDAFERIDGLFTSLNESLHCVINKLHPATLLSHGLGTAITNLCNSLQTHHGIACNVSIDMDDELLSEVQIKTLFRITQEALTNVAKHSKASMVDVTIQCQQTGVLLAIRDDGRGFDMEAHKHDGFGLVGIKERARQMEGRLEIKTANAKGTELRIWIPLTTEKTQ